MVFNRHVFQVGSSIASIYSFKSASKSADWAAVSSYYAPCIDPQRCCSPSYVYYIMFLLTQQLHEPASVSRPIHSATLSPRLLHSLGHENKSVLSLMTDAYHIYTGGQCQDIGVRARLDDKLLVLIGFSIQGLGQTYIYTQDLPSWSHWKHISP